MAFDSGFSFVWKSLSLSNKMGFLLLFGRSRQNNIRYPLVSVDEVKKEKKKLQVFASLNRHFLTQHRTSETSNGIGSKTRKMCYNNIKNTNKQAKK